jgi:hypothetical protein
MRRFCIISVLLALAATPTRADDSSAALGAGGLVLTHSADIRMADEQLSVSPKAVRIRFTFVNDSDQPIDALVAFPMPDIDAGEYSESPIGAVTEDPVNFMNFKVVAGGAPVAASVEQRALIKDRDVSAVVRAAGLPINPINATGTKALQALSPAGRKALASAADVDDPSDVRPLWTVRTRFFWRQHFLPHAPVVLEQSYQPVTGQSLFGPTELSAETSDAAYYAKTFCLDPAAHAGLARKLAAAKAAQPENGGYISAYITDYVLKTGNNWKGPIGHFHLVLDKLKPDNVLSLCWAGSLVRTSPTTFEFDAKNFAPGQDIKLLVLGSVDR